MRSTDEPMNTVLTRETTGLVVSNMHGNVPKITGDEPMGTITTGNKHMLVEPPGVIVQTGGPTGQTRRPRSTDEPLQAITTDNHRALIVPNRENAVPRDAHDEPLPTMTTINSVYVAELPESVVVAARKHTEAAIVDGEQLHTITAGGNHHFLLSKEELDPDQRRLIMANYGSAGARPGKQGWVKDADESQLGSMTTRDSHAVVTLRGPGQVRDVDKEAMPTCATVEQHSLLGVDTPIEECTFRMLEPSEIGRGMVMHLNANGEPYVVHGTRRDQVKQYGNAVTPPPMTFLVTAIRDSLS
jgi:DNA (cytosine-5)-methyltransferase 1